MKNISQQQLQNFLGITAFSLVIAACMLLSVTVNAGGGGGDSGGNDGPAGATISPTNSSGTRGTVTSCGGGCTGLTSAQQSAYQSGSLQATYSPTLSAQSGYPTYVADDVRNSNSESDSYSYSGGSGGGGWTGGGSRDDDDWGWSGGEINFTHPDLPECSDGIDNDGDGNVDHADADGVWIAGNRNSCSTMCAAYEYPLAPNANGDQCTSGEQVIGQAVEQHGGTRIFRYGCWPNCGRRDDGNGTQERGSYCYSPGQKRDNDGTDRLMGCHCELPLQQSAPDDPDCSSPEDDSESNSVTATLEVRNVTDNSAWTGGTLTIDPEDDVELRWDSTNTNSCSATSNPSGGGFSTGSATEGTDSDVVEPTFNSSRTFVVVCNGDDGASATDSVTVSTGAGADVVLSASPIYVRPGESSDLAWDVSGNDPAACSLTGPGVNLSPLPSITGTTSTTVSGESTFTLTCPGGADTVTVKVLPALQET